MITIKKVSKNMFIMQMIVNIILIGYGAYGLFKGNNSILIYIVLIVGLGGIIVDNMVYQKSKNENLKK